MKKSTILACFVVLALLGGLRSAIVQLDQENKERKHKEKSVTL